MGSYRLSYIKLQLIEAYSGFMSCISLKFIGACASLFGLNKFEVFYAYTGLHGSYKIEI